MFVQAKPAKIMKAARPLASTPDHHTSSDDATSIGSPPRPDIVGAYCFLSCSLRTLSDTNFFLYCFSQISFHFFSKFQGSGSAEELGLSSTQRTARTVIMVLRIGRISYTKLCVKPCHITFVSFLRFIQTQRG